MYKVTFSLSQKSVKNAIKRLDNYRDKVLPEKIDIFESRLAEIGLKVAKRQTYKSAMGSKIVIEVETIDGVKYLIGKSERQTVEWDNGKTNDFSPILMAEYGSGKYAGEHRGTFPNQKHAFDEVWYWKKDGVKHYSSGLKPTRPMETALLTMYDKVDEIAREVFK